jgi:hypothetical protein
LRHELRDPGLVGLVNFVNETVGHIEPSSGSRCVEAQHRVPLLNFPASGK